MDVDKLAIDLLLKGMTQEQQTAALDSIKDSVAQAKAVQKQRIGENVQVVVQALKKLEADIRARYDETGKAIEKRVAGIKDGQDGQAGRDGVNGRDGRPGRDGTAGPKGTDGINGNDGRDGTDGVSVTDANIDFDGSLIITLSSGRTINVGEVVAPDLAEKIKVITNGGGTSQTVIDALASLQTQINNIYPSQTGNAGKFLTTNGTAVSWANVAGGLSYQGTWNATTNTPTLASGVGVNGYYYITATAGSTNLDGITDWQIGDWLMFNGTVWQKIDQSNLVTSVNGQTGAVSLTSTNISEGTNLYYTDARARASVSAGTGISYSSATGVITNASPDQTVALTAGTGISTTGTYPNFTIANTAPDQTVALTQGGTTTITGTYPNFTISSADQFVGTVTSVTGTSPVASSGGTTPAISLSAGYGDTLNPYASKTANFVLAAPNGTAGVPTFRAVVAADIPTLNQNTTGSAATVTNTINSGVVATTQTAGDNSTKVATTAYVNAITGTNGITGFKNRIINGAMVIDQRNAGASVSGTTGVYTLDRWKVQNNSGAARFNVQQNAGSVTPPAGFKNYLGITSTSAYSVAAGDIIAIQQFIEGYNIADLAWGTASAATITFSFSVRSSLTGTFGGSLVEGAAGGALYPFTYTISAANTWEQKTVTVAGPTIGTWNSTSGAGIQLLFSMGTGSTFTGAAGAWTTSSFYAPTGATSVVGTSGATFYITGVQLEKGSTATAFDYRPYGTELALCQRYYYRTKPGESAPFQGAGVSFTTSSVRYILPFLVTMRTNPTALEQSGTAGDYAVIQNGAWVVNTSVPILATTSVSAISVTFTATSSFAAGGGAVARAETGNGYLGWSAEL
jgi:hypothetical protein